MGITSHMKWIGSRGVVPSDTYDAVLPGERVLMLHLHPQLELEESLSSAIPATKWYILECWVLAKLNCYGGWLIMISQCYIPNKK